MPIKPKHKTDEIPTKIKKEDIFRTPRYAIELLIPYIPKEYKDIWECAAGEGHISKVLEEHKFSVKETDIDGQSNYWNFLSLGFPDITWNCIITNPPFSLKRKFFEKCIESNKPFALLIPFDMCGWMWNAFDKYNCQGLVPSRRISFITPTGKSGKNSSAQFHSFWLTRFFNLPKQLTTIELSIEDKERIF